MAYFRPSTPQGVVQRDVSIRRVVDPREGPQIHTLSRDGRVLARHRLALEEEWDLRDALAKRPETPTPTPDPRPEPRTPARELVWRADLAEGRLRPDWTWSGFDQGQANLYPASKVIAPGEEGVPPRPGVEPGERVARFALSTADVAAGRVHAKVYRDVALKDMYGRYETWLYVPSDYRCGAPCNVFQFKEMHPNGVSDPTWWIDLLPSQWTVDIGKWQGVKPAGSNRPVFCPRWSRQDWGRGPTPFRAATPGWHHIQCDFSPQKIVYTIDGEPFFEGTAASYPLTYRDARHHIFGIGNYSANAGTVLYFGASQLTKG